MKRISVAEMFLRILLAFVAGFAVGWERESHGRPAGLRTTILVCTASAVAMLVSELLLAESAASGLTPAIRADPARLGAGILTGIGFLGAGTILRHENVVRGVTTAATLWFVAILGLAFGSGCFALGGLGLGVALVVLFILPRFEQHITSDWYAKLTVIAALEALAEEALRRRIETSGPAVLTMKLAYDFEKRQKTLTCELRLKRRERFDLPARIIADLTRCPGVVRVEWA